MAVHLLHPLDSREYLTIKLCFFFCFLKKEMGEVRIPITQGIAGHVATTGRSKSLPLNDWGIGTRLREAEGLIYPKFHTDKKHKYQFLLPGRKHVLLSLSNFFSSCFARIFLTVLPKFGRSVAPPAPPLIICRCFQLSFSTPNVSQRSTQRCPCSFFLK